MNWPKVESTSASLISVSQERRMCLHCQKMEEQNGEGMHKQEEARPKAWVCGFFHIRDPRQEVPPFSTWIPGIVGIPSSRAEGNWSSAQRVIILGEERLNKSGVSAFALPLHCDWTCARDSKSSLWEATLSHWWQPTIESFLPRLWFFVLVHEVKWILRRRVAALLPGKIAVDMCVINEAGWLRSMEQS